jgi:adenylosuccinate synthase
MIADDRSKVIVGLGFGDEGKGMTTGFLAEELAAQNRKPLVVRWNGGPQAAHNVRIRGHHHTFAQFGSGTLSGAATLLSDHMLVSPFALMSEAADLMGMGFNPLGSLLIDRHAPLLLPVHAQVNQELERSRGANRHGSVGIGVGIARAYEEDMHDAGQDSLVPRVDDLANPFKLADKVERMSAWLQDRFHVGILLPRGEVERLAVTLHTVYDDLIASGTKLTATGNVLWDRKADPGSVLFEGSQGVMLDLRYGYFPHVTYGWMLPDDVYTMCHQAGFPDPFIIGCTRTYSTRHGAGPFYPEGTADVHEPDNITGVWQGSFRTGLLDMGTLEYAADLLKPDALSIACMDTYPGSAIIGYEDDHGNTGAPIIRKMGITDAVRGIRESCGDVPVVIEGHGMRLEQWISK